MNQPLTVWIFKLVVSFD